MIPPPEYLESYYRTFCAAADINSLLVYSKYIPVDTGDKLFTMENIRNGTYPFIADCCIITVKHRTENIRKIVDFMFSSAGRELIEKTGYVTVPQK